MNSIEIKIPRKYIIQPPLGAWIFKPGIWDLEFNYGYEYLITPEILELFKNNLELCENLSPA